MTDEPQDADARTIIVAMDSEGQPAGYGVIRSETLARWEAGDVEAGVPDLFGLLHGNSDLVDTFETWTAAAAHVADSGGRVEDVVPCQAY